jgi:pyruvate/2-oxoglutarate/acetoin dehydrogenase E1 component/TPP-dependent pyruvate/acetoin dehydrogenase alpha subunit
MSAQAVVNSRGTAALPLRELLRGMRRVRAFEERVGELFSRAALPRHSHLYIGEEAVAVGTCVALRTDDYVTSTHRGHGHLIAKGAAMERAFAEIGGKATGYCKGKGGTMHVADLSLGFLGAISIVGGGMPIAVGSGLSAQVRGTDQVTACFFGDGAANSGNFGEGLNCAGIWRLPVIFVCENNQWNEYTPTGRVTAGPSIASRAAGYGMPGIVVDGNDAVAVFEAVRDATARARAGEGPTLLECVTYRARGHSTGDPARYRDPAEVEAWLAKDPIARLERRILESGVAAAEELAAEKGAIEREADVALEAALKSPSPEPEALMEDIYAPAIVVRPSAPPAHTAERSYREAITEALREEMLRDPRVILFGEDVGRAGGSFKVTVGLQAEFGESRVRDTPIAENTLVGMALGAALTGLRPVCEIMFVDLMALTMDQVVNFGAKIRYMTGGQAMVPAVIRAPGGITGAAAATHSQSLEAWFYHIPGLKVMMPSCPADAKGLLKTAIRDDNLVIFLEQKSLYNLRGPVPAGEHVVPLGSADIKRPGRDVTVVATGAMVALALEAGERLKAEGIEIEVVDPRSLVPLDLDTILSSVKKTGRAITFEEAVPRGSVGSDIAAMIASEAFDYLDGPVMRLGSPPVPVPFSPALEGLVRPTPAQLIAAARSLCGK